MDNIKNITNISKELSKAFGNIRKVLTENAELFKHNKEFQDSLSGLSKSLVRVYTETPDNLLNISKYELPKKYFVLNEFPRTESGKIKRQQISELIKS